MNVVNAVITDLKVADVLKAAREKMNDTGRHWVQGTFTKLLSVNGERHEYGYCSVGALRNVTYDQPYREELIQAAQNALAEDEQVAQVTLPTDIEVLDDNQRAYGKVVLFNDADGRRWSEVESVFRRTEARLRGEVDA